MGRRKEIEIIDFHSLMLSLFYALIIAIIYTFAHFLASSFLSVPFDFEAIKQSIVDNYASWVVALYILVEIRKKLVK